MSDRAIVRDIGFLKKERTRLINRLHAKFVDAGITTVKKADLKTEKNRIDCLAMLAGSIGKGANRLFQLLKIIEGQLVEIEEDQIKALKENELTPFVMSVPGVGPMTA